jgi:hypothetical protein
MKPARSQLVLPDRPSFGSPITPVGPSPGLGPPIPSALGPSPSRVTIHRSARKKKRSAPKTKQSLPPVKVSGGKGNSKQLSAMRGAGAPQLPIAAGLAGLDDSLDVSQSTVRYSGASGSNFAVGRYS